MQNTVCISLLCDLCLSYRSTADSGSHATQNSGLLGLQREGFWFWFWFRCAVLPGTDRGNVSNADEGRGGGEQLNAVQGFGVNRRPEFALQHNMFCFLNWEL